MEPTTSERNKPRVVSPGDKRKINSVLWELKDKNFFKSFEEKTNGIQSETRIGFSLTLFSDIKSTLYFYARKNGHGNPSTVDTGIENSTSAQYMLGENFSKDELFKILKSYINRLNIGFAIEHKLLKKITTYLSDETAPHFGIKRVRKANMKEDIAGVDIYLGMKNDKEFPLQLKKNPQDQQVHKRKFPSIPSYVFDPKLGIKETLQLFSKMAEKYFKGEIQHK